MVEFSNHLLVDRFAGLERLALDRIPNVVVETARIHVAGGVHSVLCDGHSQARDDAFDTYAAKHLDGKCFERDAAKRDEALKVLVAPFKVLDAAVSQQPYLLGGEFTVADLNVAAVISRAIEMDLSAVPNLKAWLMRCLERPAARAALALKTKADKETPAAVTRRIARINRL